MKRTCVSVYTAFLGIVLVCLLFWLAGCQRCAPPFGGSGCAQLGETEAEGHRRHLRNARISHQQMMGDLDRAMLFDKPSKASPMRIP